MRISLAIVFILLPIVAAATDMQFLQGLRNTQYTQLESSELERPFHIYTMLPDNYEENTEQRYPTIYILDGGGLFPMLTAYYHYLHAGEEVNDAIIVGISYGALDFANGNRRSTDFTAPSVEREWYGGASDFQHFLQTELLPRIEKNYRSDASRRIIFGQSIAGQFVLYTAQTRPNLFWGHIASNPALHRNLEFFLKQRPSAASSSLLFVANGSLNDERFRTPLLAWRDHWMAEANHPWQLHFAELVGHSHMSAPPAAFRQGLAWLNAVDSPD